MEDRHYKEKKGEKCAVLLFALGVTFAKMLFFSNIDPFFKVFLKKTSVEQWFFRILVQEFLKIFLKKHLLNNEPLKVCGKFACKVSRVP